MFELRNIKKSYNNNLVLDGINLKVDTGEIVAVIGRSGMGKTTIIRVATLLEKVDDGELIIDNETFDLKSITDKQVREIRLKEGLVFQNFNLFKNKTVLENLTEGLITARNYSKDRANDLAIEMLKKVNMEHKKDEYPRSLSGGESQRVGIARSLVYNPSIIFFDEPTSALDVENEQEVINVMKLMKDNKRTMLLVTHDINLAKIISDKICFLDNGNIVEEGKTNEILENPKTEQLRHFLEMSI